jgi:hypothetical protein
MTVAATSVAAYRSLDLQQSEEALMRLVHLHFPFPTSFTRKELAAKTGWEINRICGRVNSLVEKGYLKEYPQIRDGGHLLSVAPPKQPEKGHGSAPLSASHNSGGGAVTPAAGPADYPFPTTTLWGGEVVEVVSERLAHWRPDRPDSPLYTEVIVRPIRGRPGRAA